MTDIKLGTLITGPSQRDAIHIAVCPMTSDVTLYPGAKVVLENGRARLHEEGQTPIGVVDPYLPSGTVKPGETFWLLLYPGTITGLRHEWSHPAFQEDAQYNASKAFLEQYAKDCQMEYVAFMKGVAHWIAVGQEMDDDFNGYEIPADFWKHYQVVSGKTVPKEKQEDSFWSCCV